MTQLIRGIVHNSNDESMAGYTVTWSLFEAIATNGQVSAWRPARWEAGLAKQGSDFRFEFQLPAPPSPAGNVVRGPSRFEVAAPSGAVVGALALDIEETAKLLQSGTVTLSVTALPVGRLDRSQDPALGRPELTTGLVLRVGDGARVANTQVFLWGSAAGTTTPLLLATAQTDPRGYFFCNRPRPALSVAYATVSGYSESVPVRLDDDGRIPLRIVLGLTTASKPPATATKCGCGSSGLLPYAADATTLATSDAYGNDMGGGHCVDLTTPNRALEEFSYYMVLRTTDPEIQGLTLPPPPRQTQIGTLIDSFQAYGVSLETGNLANIPFPGAAARTAGATAPTAATNPNAQSPNPDGPNAAGPNPASPNASGADLPGSNLPAPDLPASISLPASVSRALTQINIETEAAALATWSKKSAGRAVLNAANPIDWDNEPTFYQATTIAHGHLLHFKQVWKSYGYSLGTLLYSLPLAPLQKKQIAIVDWERREVASRSEDVESADALQANLSHDRLINDTVNATLEETIRGGSDVKTSSWGAAGGAWGGPTIPLFGGIAGGASNASSTSWQNSGRDLSASALSTLSDAVTQSASAVRRLRSTVVQQMAQGETTTVTTEVIANNNHCHALTMEYFEVLRHFIIEHQLADVRECLFIPLLMSRFDNAKALRWREPLQRGLRNRRLLKAFDAVERQLNTAFYADYPVARYADDPIVELWGDLAISFQIPRPSDGEEGAFDETSWQPYAPLLWDSALSIFNLYLLGVTTADRERVFKETIAPRLAEAFVDQLEFSWRDDSLAQEKVIKLDATLMADYAEHVPLAVSVRMKGALANEMTRASLNVLIIKSTVELPTYSKVVVESGTMRYRTEHLEYQLFSSNAIDNDLKTGLDDVEIACPLASRELRDPRQEDKDSAAQLVAHLNEHLEYYHKVIWWYMDHDRRYMLLDGFVAPNALGRSVASVVENRIVAISGNCLVMPVAPGFALDPAFDRMTPNGSGPIDLLEHYAPTTPTPPVRISLPTKGVYAEAVMGACNSCEKIDDARFWKFEEHPSPDEPTPILPVSTDSRAQPAPNLTASPFPQSIISMQNAPAAPDPAGLAGALQVLGASSLFRDATGLAGNQQNAGAALQAALSSATTMGLSAAQLGAIDRAAELQKQKMANENADRIRDDIQTARDSGLISDEAAQARVDDLTKQQIGAPTPAPAPTPIQDGIAQGLGTALSDGRAVTVSDGTNSFSASAAPAPSAAPAEDVPPLFVQDADDREHVFTLAATVKPVSMCLSSQVAAGALPLLLTVRDERWNTNLYDIVESPEFNGSWGGTVGADPTTTSASSIDYSKQTGLGAASYNTLAAFDTIEWLPLTVSGLAVGDQSPRQLPLSAAYEIAHLTVRNTSIPNRRNDLYGLASEIEFGRLQVYGFVIGKNGQLRALTPAEAGDREFSAVARNFGGDGSVVVLATVELVLCKPDYSYEPSGWLQAARVYPLLGFWCSSDFESVVAQIRLTRPLASSADALKDYAAYPGYEHKPALFTEMNGTLAQWAVTGAYRWSDRYAHYVTDARDRGNVVVVDENKVSRSDEIARGVYDLTANQYLRTTVTKLAQQGAFDTVIVGPSLNYESGPAGMQESLTAPLTVNDTLHVHWRWSDSFTTKPQLGWSGSSAMSEICGGTPHQVAGAPQVPHFQTVELIFDDGAALPAFTYQVTVPGAGTASKWHIFMHHGCGFVIDLAATSGALLSSEVAEGRLPTWSNFYQFNRYTYDSNGGLIPRVDESNFGPLEQM